MEHSRIWKRGIFRIWKWYIFIFEMNTFSYLKKTHFSYVKMTHFSFLKIPDFRIWNGLFFLLKNGTFRILKLHISFLIIRRLRDKVTWNMSTFEMLAFEMSSSEGKNKQQKFEVKVLTRSLPEQYFVTLPDEFIRHAEATSKMPMAYILVISYPFRNADDEITRH